MVIVLLNTYFCMITLKWVKLNFVVSFIDYNFTAIKGLKF